MLTPASCDLFRQPFFQFARLKQYCPERIPQIKADYRAAWLVWQLRPLPNLQMWMQFKA